MSASFERHDNPQCTHMQTFEYVSRCKARPVCGVRLYVHLPNRAFRSIIFLGHARRNAIDASHPFSSAIDAAGLDYEGDHSGPHVCEAIVNDVGMSKIKREEPADRT